MRMSIHFGNFIFSWKLISQVVFSWKLLLQMVVTLGEVGTCLSEMRIQKELSQLLKMDAGQEHFHSVTESVLSNIERSSDFVLILVTDGRCHQCGALMKNLCGLPHLKGISVIDLTTETLFNYTELEELDHFAKQVRLGFQDTRVLVLSDDVTFFWNFAEYSLRSRLVARNSRLVGIGRLAREDVDFLMDHWIYSMMDGIIVIPKNESLQERWELLSCLPFTSYGKKVKFVGEWSSTEGFIFADNINIFPEKFTNLHGATVNVTTLPYEPYWIEEKFADGRVSFSGTDRFMLEAMASSFNFSIGLVPVQHWSEVLGLVAKRSAWTAPVVHSVLPSRLELVDFTRTYEDENHLAFVMVKPILEPKWQSLYDPLNHEVWLCILGTTAIISFSLFIILKSSVANEEREFYSYSFVVMEIYKILLAQGMSSWHSTISSVRLLLAVWFLSTYIIGTAYKGNLVASLVAPFYPSRPETLEELVEVVDRMTMPSFGKGMKEMLMETQTQSLVTLGAMIDIGYETNEGLSLTVKCRYPYLDSIRFIQNHIALHYTEADGSSPFYIGREGLASVFNGWPIPHDAPYKSNFDFVISSLIEGGIYNKWMADWLEAARRLGRRSKRLEQEAKYQKEKETDETADGELTSRYSVKEGDEPKALTIVHFQGPLLIWVIGNALAGFAIILENLVLCCTRYFIFSK